MVDIAGSLWSVAPAEQLPAARRLQAVGLTRLHWDLTDGRFADAGGFRAAEALRITHATGLRAEAHIMAVDSLTEVDPWTEFCDLVVVHAESDDWQGCVDRIAARGSTPGLAISPETSPSAVPSDIAVLCMTVRPGKAGSRFDEGVLRKIDQLLQVSPGRAIGLDGGVLRQHVPAAVGAGVTWLVVGTDLFLNGGERRWKDVLAPS